MKKSVSYRPSLLKFLKDPENAVSYLNVAIEEGDREAFLMALRDVIEVHAPMAEMARRTKIHRVSLHKMFAGGGNPTAESLIALFRVLGISLRLNLPKRANKTVRKAA